MSPGPFGLGEDQRRSGLSSVGHEKLAAVENVCVSVSASQCVLVAGVGARLGLGERIAPELSPTREGNEEALLLLPRPELRHGITVERVVHRHDGSMRGAGTCDFLESQHVSHGVAPGSSQGLRNGYAHQAELTHAAHRLPREARFAVDGLRDGAHLLLREVSRHLLDHALLVRELDVHGSSARYLSRSFLNSFSRSGATSKRSPTMP